MIEYSLFFLIIPRRRRPVALILRHSVLYLFNRICQGASQKMFVKLLTNRMGGRREILEIMASRGYIIKFDRRSTEERHHAESVNRRAGESDVFAYRYGSGS